LPQPVARRRRPGLDRLIRQVPLHVPGQAGDRVVPAVAVLLQAPHDDPVEFPAHRRQQVPRLGPPGGGRGRQRVGGGQPGRGAGLPSTVATRTLDGLRSRWTIPFWWACWTARQTSTKSRSRSRIVSRASSQYRVSGGPATSSMTKNGEQVSVTPPSRTLAMLGWS